MNPSQNGSSVCRICLRLDIRKFKNIFDEYKSVFIHQNISMIANVVIDKHDGLPQIICSSCMKSLNTAIEFKNKCESSDAILRAAYQDIKVVVKKEEPEPEEQTQYLEELIDYVDSNLVRDEPKAEPQPEPEFIDTKPKLNMVQLGLRPSRSIDLQVECHDCGGLFKTKCKLRVHWKKVHLPESLVCNTCKRQFKSFKAYNLHKYNEKSTCKLLSNARIVVNGKKRIFHCKECTYSTNQTRNFKSHLVTHTGVRPFVCDLCGSSHTQQSSLQAHKESVHKAYLVESTCPYCGKFIKGRSRMYKHLKIHREKEAECNICKKMFKSVSSMLQHKTRHTGIKGYACETCGGAFFTLSELCNHKRTVHRKDKTWYKCDRCSYQAHRKESISKHLKKHTPINIPCTVCGMFFDSEVDLSSHQKIHFGVRNYQCQYCEKKFLTRDGVYKHVRHIHFKNVEYTPHTFALPDSKRGRKKDSEKLEKIWKFNPILSVPPNSVKKEEENSEVVEIK